MRREDFEIMAPVGSRESLAAAINAGANSVYFGIGKLNMRSHSANDFTIEDLKEIAQICHENGLKSYLTVNTIIYGEDLATMREIIDAAKEAARFGIGADRAANYHADSAGTELIYEAVSETVRNFRASQPMAASWKRSIDADYRNRK